jgi:EmrB/QacA subfamily drug resistance transporter
VPEVSDSRRRTLTLVATILGSNVVFLDGTVVNVALPAIQRDLETGLAAQQWVVEAYLLTLVAVLLVGGSFGDLYGRKRIFELGLAGFAVTSVLCALAPTSGLLIAARGLQGLAGALLVPGSLAIIAATFHGAARGRAVGTWTAWAGIATLAGPAAGGLLVQELSWRWVFWVNIPLIAFTLWLSRRVVRESSDPDACPGIDYVGIVLSAVGLGGPVFALLQQPVAGWSSPLVWVPMLVGLASLVGFVLWERRTRAPMLPLELFKVRNFTVANASTLAVYAGLYGSSFFLSIFLQQVGGYRPLIAGLATLPITVVMFVLSPRFGALASGVGPRLPMSVGPVIAGVGLLLMLRIDSDAAYLSDVLPALLPFSLGLAMTVAPLTATVLDSVPERHAGIASGVNNAFSRIAGLLAIAVLGAAISAQFASSVDSDPGRAGLGQQSQAAIEEAKEAPFAGADIVGIPVPERGATAEVTTDAAVSGFHLGVGIAGLLSIAGGLIAAIGIRNPPGATRQGEASEAEPAAAAA